MFEHFEFLDAKECFLLPESMKIGETLFTCMFEKLTLLKYCHYQLSHGMLRVSLSDVANLFVPLVKL